MEEIKTDRTPAY